MRIQSLTDGIFKNNATFRQVLGLCPTLAVTTAAINGVAMGLATTTVLVCSNFAISLLARFVPKSVRIPAYILVIASFVTVVDLLMNAYFHTLHGVLGLFIPLIVVNCIVLGRAEMFASKNGVGDSVLDGLGMGIGFTLSLTLLASIRELLGAGSIFDVMIMPASYTPFILMILPTGAFLTIGILMAIINYLSELKARRVVR